MNIPIPIQGNPNIRLRGLTETTLECQWILVVAHLNREINGLNNTLMRQESMNFIAHNSM